ncbi:MAG TPA: hypothetical protein VIY47_02460 [Ignavibacteriaceae bacterium]
MKNNCPKECTIFFERRIGKNGAYYHCHQCKKNISENNNGEPASPSGTCGICGGLLFSMIKNGKSVNVCWSPEKHFEK